MEKTKRVTFEIPVDSDRFVKAYAAVKGLPKRSVVVQAFTEFRENHLQEFQKAMKEET